MSKFQYFLKIAHRYEIMTSSYPVGSLAREIHWLQLK